MDTYRNVLTLTLPGPRTIDINPDEFGAIAAAANFTGAYLVQLGWVTSAPQIG